MTPKMKAFVEGKAAGLSNRDAAVSAGYTSLAAGETATRLLKRPDVKKALKAALKVQTASIPAARNAPEGEEDAAKLRTDYTDSLDFMRQAMNNAKLPLGVRFDAAKQLLPYEHARIGEKGKKESKQDAAREVGRGKFAPKKPPALHVVK